MKDDLKFVFDNTNGWLKFVEAKNLAMVTLCVAFIIMDIQLLKDIGTNLKLLLLSLYFLAVFIATLLMALYSVIAKVDNRLDTSDFAIPRYLKGYNLLFYEDIIKFSEETYLQSFARKYGGGKNCSIAYQRDLVNQIICNSRIVHKKACFFNIGVRIFMGGCIIGIIMAIVVIVT